MVKRYPSLRDGWSLPVIHGLRGAGLGNEAIGWAKAFIGARELGLRVVHPAWGMNQRKYWRDFETSRLDWLAHRAVAPLAVDIGWPEVAATGFDDYGLALRALRNHLPLGRRPLVVRHVSGMAGGFLAVRSAREYLLAEILRPRHVTQDLYGMADPGLGDDVITVAVHVRAGDFSEEADGPRPGQFNRRIPGDWYLKTCRSLRSQLRDQVVILVFTDEPSSPVVRRLVQEVGAILPPHRDRPLLSDLAAMALADLLVCSISSMSMLGAFLSGKPYLWYEPHLDETGGWRSIWGCQTDQRDGVTARNRSGGSPSLTEVHRGVPVHRDGRVPDGIVENLVEQCRLRDRKHDLVLYGVVPGDLRLRGTGQTSRSAVD